MRLNLTINKTNGLRMKKAYLASGCFWCTETIFDNVDGVTKVIPGYMGGTKKNPTYEEVCMGVTGHVETVNVFYDQKQIKFETILKTFWECHDPTQGMRQGNDIGEQYKSILFYNSEDEKEIIESKIEKIDLSGKFENPIVTEIRKTAEFYPAEEYHQDYAVKTGKLCYQQLYVMYNYSPIPATTP